ncbi:MAG: class I tRNA ligase family protein, partial [Pseudomonadota bacterium]
MSFDPVTGRYNGPSLEAEVLEFWREHDVFAQSLKNRESGPRFSFNEGPPTANGKPGIHHVLARTFKDVFPRYKTMQGHY